MSNSYLHIYIYIYISHDYEQSPSIDLTQGERERERGGGKIEHDGSGMKAKALGAQPCGKSHTNCRAFNNRRRRTTRRRRRGKGSYPQIHPRAFARHGVDGALHVRNLLLRCGRDIRVHFAKGCFNCSTIESEDANTVFSVPLGVRCRRRDFIDRIRNRHCVLRSRTVTHDGNGSSWYSPAALLRVLLVLLLFFAVWACLCFSVMRKLGGTEDNIEFIIVSIRLLHFRQ